MMLSSEDVQLEIKKGNLVIDPLLEDSLRPVGLRLHLAERLLKPVPGKIADVKKRIVPDYEEIIISEDKPYQIEPGEFVLGATYEKVTVGMNLGFLIEGRSTLARLGLTIVQTAMLVDPGHRDRQITLELANHGVNPILLYPLMKIARAAVFELKTPAKQAYDDFGKYRAQATTGEPVFDHEVVALKKP